MDEDCRIHLKIQYYNYTSHNIKKCMLSDRVFTGGLWLSVYDATVKTFSGLQHNTSVHGLYFFSEETDNHNNHVWHVGVVCPGSDFQAMMLCKSNSQPIHVCKLQRLLPILYGSGSNLSTYRKQKQAFDENCY